MGSIFTSLLIQMGVFIVTRFGVPFLEARFPMLTPLLTEILSVIAAKASPSPELTKTADHFADLKNSAGPLPTTKNV